MYGNCRLNNCKFKNKTEDRQMQLSVRLEAVAKLAGEGTCLVDIGTDHAYVPIRLVESGKYKRALAMDVNKGPLLRAEENIRLHGLEDKIETRLSDGARNLCAGEADTAVIAGMGGALTIRILTQGRENLEGVGHFVLQPQSEIENVRRFLHRHGFSIDAEDMVKDEGKYYPMMRVSRGEQKAWSLCEYRFGKYLIGQKNPVLVQFLEKEEKKLLQILEKLKENTAEEAVRRRESLGEELAVIRKVHGQLVNKDGTVQ